MAKLKVKDKDKLERAEEVANEYKRSDLKYRSVVKCG